MPAAYASGYDAHPITPYGIGTYPRACVQRIRTKKNLRTLGARACFYVYVYTRERVCTLRLGTTHVGVARHPRGCFPRGSECFAALRDLPPASANPPPQHLARKSKHSFGFINFAFNSRDSSQRRVSRSSSLRRPKRPRVVAGKQQVRTRPDRRVNIAL